MCNANCIIFGITNLSKKEVEGKKIIEVGSYNVNGSFQDFIKNWNPDKYIGVDIEKGPGVDVICRAENIIKKFGKESFDIVISTELLEHVRNWRKVISNIKNICKPNGIILITARSIGAVYHAFPYDFWRYELEDMKHVFSDCELLSLEKDTYPGVPGVFVKVKKPERFIEIDLSVYKLYSMIVNKRIKDITDKDFQNFYFKRKKSNIIKNALNFHSKIINFILSKI